nr:unnamed protein product [Callosobruchus analis]
MIKISYINISSNRILYETLNTEHEERGEAPASPSTLDSIKFNITWSNDETRLILDKYEQYLSLVGPMKKFKNKKLMWMQISKDLKNHFGVERTPQQTENRYKTILKRKKTAMDENHRTGSVRHEVMYEKELRKIAAIDDNIEPQTLRGVRFVQHKQPYSYKKPETVEKKKENKLTCVLRETLLEINRIKEEGREKRHREKMDILKKMMEVMQKK